MSSSHAKGNSAIEALLMAPASANKQYTGGINLLF